MNTIRNTVARKGAWLSTLALAAALNLGDKALAQATPKPPERMTYQGFIAGSDGTALGNTAPKNYDVIFRVYDAESNGTLLWGEQQTVTVDKGYFSVLLGEGAPVAGIPNAGITLSSLFNSATASDRYVAFTVKGIGTGGADVDILPRVRLMSSPYAFLANKALSANTAASATTAVKLVQEANGTDLLSGSGSNLSLNGNLLVNNGKYLMLGVGAPGKEASAGMIAYQLNSPDSLEIIGAGPTAGGRKITLYNEGGVTFNGPGSFSGPLLAIGGVNIPSGTGVVFGSNATKQYPLNGSILYAGGSVGPIAGQDTLLIQGGGNVTATRTVTTYSEGGFYLIGPLTTPAGARGTINLGYDATKQVDNGKIGYQVFSGGLDIVGAGATVVDRWTVMHSAVTVNALGQMARIPLYVGGYKFDAAGRAISLQAEQSIAAVSYIVSSDRRIKDIVGISQPQKDLEVLRKIQVTDYRFKTLPGHASPLVKGVIAQEVEPVLPQAISKMPNIIPCDRIQAVAIGWNGADKLLSIKMGSAHGLDAGQDIRVDADGVPVTLSVKSVTDANTIVVEGRTLTSEPKSVALIGREVKDFLSVDYQQIYMTAVSALQEVDRRLQLVEQREARLEALERKAARVESLENDLAELRKLVADIKAGAKANAGSASASGAARDAAVALSR